MLTLKRFVVCFLGGLVLNYVLVLQANTATFVLKNALELPSSIIVGHAS